MITRVRQPHAGSMVKYLDAHAYTARQSFVDHGQGRLLANLGRESKT
jgi:hypothetical protein